MRQIACINICSEKASDAATFVLADFKDAYAAYEHMTSSANEEQNFEFIDKATQADSVVIAYESAQEVCEYVATLHTGTKVYGICLGDIMPSQAIASIETACKRNECGWQGVLLISKEPVVVAALQKKPRLGWWRRKLSEATDRLIACVRAGVSVQEAADLFGASKKQRVQANRNLILL